jgi:hypothetical protein
VQDYFEERPIFGRRDLILGAHTMDGKKATWGKGRKSNMQEKKPHARRQTILTILGLGFFTKVVCNDPKPLCKDHHCFGVFLKLFLSEVFCQTLC